MKAWILAACLPLLAACASTDPVVSETTLLRPATPQGQACARQCDTLRAACTGAPMHSAPATLGGDRSDPKPTAASCATTHRDCVLDCGGRLVGD
ncbi:hypothetical protein EA658_07560 [Pseudoxanthomonas winnipegensis]|uniref:Lipoprotein n=1 Tax=Pseudoxanthomonas winnipegensis TaxID=2480810 RepID=A0ABY1WFR3_9GAMM|nr:hypothetical protein [Pseudoxanthomonas winnipegensis]TAA07149.1 hypothetical protein EA659_17785 [Pseudoxanthomonas winnipegensis]TAA20790.1 hypothetical protein EA658_07560 [Pseudoxanthomonas winnipegensis]TAH72260.1 hypothetical protein EA657_08280 [Pseudoxanthomonas winnipegensis]